MARVYRPTASLRPLVFGAIGGMLAAALALLVLLAGTAWLGDGAIEAANAVGAWFVRWLQGAAPDALAGVYLDATFGGALSVLLLGAALGAAFAGLVEHVPEDHPAAWGVMAGLALWAVNRWWWLPAIDPLATRLLPERVLLVAHVVFGLALGAWVDAAGVVDEERARS